MILTNEEAAQLKEQYTHAHREFAISVTDRCNMHCAVCYMESGEGVQHTVSKQLIKRAIDLLDKEWYVVITGGECTLRLDLCKYIIEECHKKGIPVRLKTNGLWRCSIKKMIELDADVMSLGINQYHKKLSPKRANKIIKAFSSESVRTKLTINTFLNTDLSEYQIPDGMCVIHDNISPIGRGLVNALDSASLHWTSCSSQGLKLLPTGHLVGFCRQGRHACSFGDMNYIDSSDFARFKEVLKRLPMFRWLPNGASHPYACPRGNAIFNPAFDDDKTILDVTE